MDKIPIRGNLRGKLKWQNQKVIKIASLHCPVTIICLKLLWQATHSFCFSSSYHYYNNNNDNFTKPFPALFLIDVAFVHVRHKSFVPWFHYDSNWLLGSCAETHRRLWWVCDRMTCTQTAASVTCIIASRSVSAGKGSGITFLFLFFSLFFNTSELWVNKETSPLCRSTRKELICRKYCFSTCIEHNCF